MNTQNHANKNNKYKQNQIKNGQVFLKLYQTWNTIMIMTNMCKIGTTEKYADSINKDKLNFYEKKRKEENKDNKSESCKLSKPESF